MVLLEQGESQAERLGAEIVNDEVISVVQTDKTFKVNTTTQEYSSKVLLITTGNPPKTAGVKGADKYEGNGIHYCASCDGFFYKNLKIGVLGNKEYAIHEANELLNYTKDITIFTNNRPLELSDKYCEDAKKFTINDKCIKQVEGKEAIETIVFKDETVEKIDGLFVAEGTASSVDFARKLGIMMEGNTITVDKNQMTNIQGIFAAGDCTGGVRQISTAVGEGAVAGKRIIEYVNKENGEYNAI
jgi:thioredoxin reductase (NADPH)